MMNVGGCFMADYMMPGFQLAACARRGFSLPAHGVTVWSLLLSKASTIKNSTIFSRPDTY